MLEFWQELFKAPAFYTAGLALIHAVLFYLAPTFPREIVVAADGFVAVVASVWCGKTVEAKRNAAQIEGMQARILELETRP